MTREKTHYEILGLDNSASISEIKAQYRKLSSLYHPDKNKNGAQYFKKINQAYNVLSSTKKKLEYDSSLVVDIENQDTNYEPTDGVITKDKLAPKIITNVISLNESKYGFVRNFIYEATVICKSCNGEGCIDCFGTGVKLAKKMIKGEWGSNILPSTISIFKNCGDELVGYENGDVHVVFSWGNKSWKSKDGDLYSTAYVSNRDIKKGFFTFKNYDGKKYKVFFVKKDIDNILLVRSKGWKGWSKTSDLYLFVKKYNKFNFYTWLKSLFNRFF